MRRRVLLCSIAILVATVIVLSSVAMASAKPRHAMHSVAQPGQLTRSVRADRVRYRRHVFRQVTVRRDIAYARVRNHAGVEETLRLDVYAPRQDSARRRATIVWLHPGGFTEGDKSIEARYARDFAERGYVSIAIDYRLRPAMQWFDLEQRRHAAGDAYADATTSIRWIRRNALRYGVDAAHIFVAGYSAGAITAQEVAAPPDGSRSLLSAR
jgi:carboxylesterase type B